MGPAEIQRLKTWLQSSEAKLFVETLQARSYVATYECGEQLKVSVLRNDQGAARAQGLAADAAILDTLIAEMENMVNDASLMVKLSLMPAQEPTQPTEEN